MKESTIVITAQLTVIRKHPDNKPFRLDKKAIAHEIKKEFNCDDVLVTDAKVFEKDIDVLGKKKKDKSTTLCWECKKVCGKCSWSRDFTPVPGWEAEPIKKRYQGKVEETYIVLNCPEFERA